MEHIKRFILELGKKHESYNDSRIQAHSYSARTYATAIERVLQSVLKQRQISTDTKALRQKKLNLAIRGKLVPQDPNDDPASVLLERIKAEKERLIKEG